MDTSLLERALNDISRIAAEVITEEAPHSNGAPPTEPATDIGCFIKRLPARLHEQAATVSARLNPANAPLRELVAPARLGPDSPLALTLTTAKYWGPQERVLSVSFMEATPADLRARIVSHMNAWSSRTCVSFAETAGTGDVRISRGQGGYWSYLGTDITLVPRGRQTMNLQAFTMDTPESEFHRVIRHEAGHTLGFPHEHMRRELVQRIDPVKAYPYFLATQGWSKEMVDQQVLTPLDDATIIGTPADQDSIMCYQLTGSITFDGKPIRGGLDINASDYTFAGSVYPKTPCGTNPDGTGNLAEGDWAPSEDVAVPT